MSSDRFYSAEKYARRLDVSSANYQNRREEALKALYGSLVEPEEWDELAEQAGIDADVPQHESTMEGIAFWDVRIPGYVLLARDKRGNHFAVTTWLSERFDWLDASFPSGLS